MRHCVTYLPMTHNIRPVSPQCRCRRMRQREELEEEPSGVAGGRPEILSLLIQICISACMLVSVFLLEKVFYANPT